MTKHLRVLRGFGSPPRRAGNELLSSARTTRHGSLRPAGFIGPDVVFRRALVAVWYHRIVVINHLIRPYNNGSPRIRPPAATCTNLHGYGATDGLAGEIGERDFVPADGASYIISFGARRVRTCANAREQVHVYTATVVRETPSSSSSWIDRRENRHVPFVPYTFENRFFFFFLYAVHGRR